MEGPATARPNLRHAQARRSRTAPFNGGPGNCPAEVGSGGRGFESRLPCPSMEGRANARPNVGHRDRERGTSRPCGSPRPRSFNGGPGKCPAEPRGQQVGSDYRPVPSMEGRASARPNPMNRALRSPPCHTLQWRAGQLPGRTTRPRSSHSRSHGLQWRAGQVPGRTGRAALSAGVHRGPSMEGRAIARPNLHTGRSRGGWGTPLQWRAGQLPGRTRCSRNGCGPGGSCFNGGPGNCPAEPPEAGTP